MDKTNRYIDAHRRRYDRAAVRCDLCGAFIRPDDDAQRTEDGRICKDCYRKHELSRRSNDQTATDD